MVWSLRGSAVPGIVRCVVIMVTGATRVSKWADK